MYFFDEKQIMCAIKRKKFYMYAMSEYLRW